ncbi:hypothetical protein [Accumulibacter sp.]|uniref:hypothetical protein n=1 Tax=Accumulibacter sp. TaxID=2053492 RepID=UPI00262A3E9F|nr:hypothetical protein [Accumulibacter sp.]
MNREELRDQLLEPVLQCTRLGRQASQLMVAASEVIDHRSRQLRRAGPIPGEAVWSEVALMTREKIDVPLESATAMATAMVPAVQRFWTHAAESMCALGSDSLSLASSPDAEQFRIRQAALTTTIINAAVGWFQLWGVAADIASQGLKPVLRHTKANAERLAKR